MTIIIKKNTSVKEFNKIIENAQKKHPKTKGFDAKKFCGVIKSFENVDPIKIQKEWRDEWK